jgi:hypothetical protein
MDTYMIYVRTRAGQWREVAGPFRSSDEYGALHYYWKQHHPHQQATLVGDSSGGLGSHELVFTSGAVFRAVQVA